jgi:hypothetical protein
MTTRLMLTICETRVTSHYIPDVPHECGGHGLHGEDAGPVRDGRSLDNGGSLNQAKAWTTCKQVHNICIFDLPGPITTAFKDFSRGLFDTYPSSNNSKVQERLFMMVYGDPALQSGISLTVLVLHCVLHTQKGIVSHWVCECNPTARVP